MASTTVGVVPVISPANSGVLLRRRRDHDGDRDGATKTTEWTTRVDVGGVDGKFRSETRWRSGELGSSPGRCYGAPK